MDKATNIVSELRKRGLSNGGSLGYHSGLMDEAADLIEKQQAVIASYTSNQGCADVAEQSKLKQLIARKYGDLDNNRGCNVNGQWLSVAAIVELIDQAATE